MILLFTDFGPAGPYLGQMEAVLRLNAPGVEVVNLVSNAPMGEPRLAAYLLAALAVGFPKGSVFLSVVDPGVGGQRLPVVLEADGRWFVGPDNSLFNAVAAQAEGVVWRIISWRPEHLSASFHGRDLFAPVAARIALGDWSWSWSDGDWPGPDLSGSPPDIASIVYFDHYGNAMTGWRYSESLQGKALQVNGERICQARTFSDLAPGEPFWYCNSMGLIEIAVNRNCAREVLGLSLGQGFRFEEIL
jgi:S-adenosylmethionine hydrolase